jgi:hypothetical protein
MGYVGAILIPRLPHVEFHLHVNKTESQFAKFVDSSYYSESELCGGAVHFLQRSTPFSKTCCRPLITSKFLASELLFMVGKAQKSDGERSGLYGGCSDGVPPIHFSQAEHRIQFRWILIVNLCNLSHVMCTVIFVVYASITAVSLFSSCSTFWFLP